MPGSTSPVDPAARKPERLRITEIFHSLQGEARDVGRPTVFVRLTGCPLRCVWCDTEYAFKAANGGPFPTLWKKSQSTRRTMSA